MTTNATPDPRLLSAIRRKRLIALRFKDKDRVAEPHDYGIRDGRETLLAWQLEPEAGWRWFEIARISALSVVEEKSFAGGRSAPSGKHHAWDRLFARVGQAE
jgi:predicted DNA-binding transcriptional regulator YafY